MRGVFGLSLLSAALIAGAAQAADLPVKAPPKVVPIWSWTGFYVGGNVGYSWGKAKSDINVDPSAVDFGFGPFIVPGAAGSDSAKPKGVIGGAQIGYNLQRDNLIFGIETDLQASGEKARRDRGDTFTSGLVPLPAPLAFASLSSTSALNYEAKISWFGTLRGRAGYLITPNVFAYATGGLAYGQVKLAGGSSLTGTASTLFCPVQAACIPQSTVPFSAADSFSHSRVNVGWTLGGGFEGALWNRWSWKVEYLYMDLGSVDTIDGQVVVSVTGGAMTAHTHFTDNIVRVGLNYKFN